MSERSSTTTRQARTDHGLQDDVQRLGRQVGQLHDDLAGIAKSAGAAAQSGVTAIREGGRSALEAVKDKGDAEVASLRGYLVNHPGAALGIAVGAGFLIGLAGPAIARSLSRSS
jgi:ElaB/YqjD/DUF883 family membrane-anchored ribosome-binding protein